LGIYVRPIRIRDNLQLSPNAYVFKLRGEESASGELMPGHFMAMDPTGQDLSVPGIPTVEPTFGLPAWWIPATEKDRVEMMGLTVVDCSTILVTHLTEFIKNYGHELLGRQEVKELIDVVREKDPAVLDDLPPELISLGDIQKVLQNLLREKVPIRDLVTILEALADGVRMNKDIDFLIEHTRQAMSRSICRAYVTSDNKLQVITLHPKLEQILADAIQPTQLGAYPVIEPGLARQVLDKAKDAVEKVSMRGITPVVLCSPRVRLPFKRFTERYLPALVVLSLNEVASSVEVEVMGTVAVE